MSDFGIRDGEERLGFDPATMPADAGLVFIGHVSSPWRDRGACPKNMAQARESGGGGSVEIDAAWRRGLVGIERASHIIVLTWLDRSPRDLIVQKPRHAQQARGTFSLRSPARPNPVGIHVVRLVAVDVDQGRLTLDAIDVLDGTPVIDVKPYYASTDCVANASVIDP